MKKVPLITGIAALIVFLLLYPESCLSSARYGLELWFNTVLPALFPFALASFMLLETGLVHLIAHFFAPVTRFLWDAPGESAYIFLAAAFSGYPVGARLAAELYQTGRLSETDAQTIVRFTSVSGPVFITGAVAAGMLGLPEAGIYLAATHYLGALLTGVVFGLFRRRRTERATPQRLSFREALVRFREDAEKCPPVGALMADGVDKAMSLMLRIGGYIVLFSVIMELLSVTGILELITMLYSPLARLAGVDRPIVSAGILGGVEATTGCAKAAALAAPLSLKLPLIASIIAFGGLCIHMQTHAVCAKAGLKPKGFTLAKTLHGALSAALCALAFKLFPLAAAASSIAGGTKNAAYYGVIFVVATLFIVAGIRLVRNRRRGSILPFR
jgi:sporulation integral membrane protein YlbJ